MLNVVNPSTSTVEENVDVPSSELESNHIINRKLQNTFLKLYSEKNDQYTSKSAGW